MLLHSLVALSLPLALSVSDGEPAAFRGDRIDATVADAGLPGFPNPFRRKPKKAATAKPNPAPTADQSPMAATDRRLRLLVSQQERWYADKGRYGHDVVGLSRKDVVKDAAMDLVQVQVLYANSRGWTALASHPGAPGKSCVVFVGLREKLPIVPRTRAEAREAVDEGRPSCDR